MYCNSCSSMLLNVLTKVTYVFIGHLILDFKWLLYQKICINNKNFYFVQAIFNEIDKLFLQLYQDVTTNLLSSSNQFVKGTI